MFIVQRNPAVLWTMKTSGNYETRSSKLTDENAKCRVEFEKGCLENADIGNTDCRPQTSKTQTLKD